MHRSRLSEPAPANRSVVTAVIALLFVAVACGQPDLIGKEGPLPGDDNTWAENAKQARFVALGDLGSGKPEQLAVAEAMCNLRREQPFDHVVTTGDNVYPTGDSKDFANKFIRPYSCLLSDGVRFHAVLGNHDIDNEFKGLSQVDQPVFGFNGSPYYTWSLGPVNFIMANSQTMDLELDSPAGTGKQYEWMLEQAENMKDGDWTVVVFHDPVFSTGVKHPSKPGWAEAVGEPLAAAGVDLILNGHDHNYQHAESDGVNYIVTGGGGGAIYPCDEPFVEPVDECISAYHFVEIEAKESAMTVTAVAPDGSTLDSVTFGPNP